MKKKYIGIIAVLISACMWALEPMYAKLSYAQSTFLQTSIIRGYVVTIIAGLYIVFTTKTVRVNISKKNLPSLIYIAICGTIIADLLYFYALLKTPMVNAVLLGHIQPMFIIIFAYIWFKNETLDLKKYIGICFLMMSAIFVSSKTIDDMLTFQFGTIGDALVLIATMLWATTALVMRHYLMDLSAGTITFFRFLFASCIFTFILPFIQINQITYHQIMVGIVVCIGTICYYEGLKRLKAAEVSGIELAAPVFAAIIGFLIFNELIASLQIIGIICLFIGVYLISSIKQFIKQNYIHF